MTDSDLSDPCEPNSYHDIQKEIQKCKRNPEMAGMFVSGWDEAEQDVDVVQNPKANPTDHILWAAENGDVDTLKRLLTMQPELVHVQDSDGYTPLHRASYGNYVTAIAYLLSVGANVSIKTELGWTPLHSACNWNNYNAVARLLAAGADPNISSDGGQTTMHLASAISHSKSSLLLMFLRDDVVETANMPNNSGETPKQLALGHGIYAPLFEMISPFVSYINSAAFTYNPFVRKQLKIKILES